MLVELKSLDEFLRLCVEFCSIDIPHELKKIYWHIFSSFRVQDKESSNFSCYFLIQPSDKTERNLRKFNAESTCSISSFSKFDSLSRRLTLDLTRFSHKREGFLHVTVLRFEFLLRFLRDSAVPSLDSSARLGTNATRARRCVRCRWARARPRQLTGAAASWRPRPRRITTWTPCSGTCSPSRRTARSRYSRCRATTR